MTQLQKTRAALAAYYADMPRRDALWITASDEAGLHAAREADDAALLALRTVFADETRAYNAHLVAMSATAREIRQAVGMTDDEAHAALVSAFGNEAKP